MAQPTRVDRRSVQSQFNNIVSRCRGRGALNKSSSQHLDGNCPSWATQPPCLTAPLLPIHHHLPRQAGTSLGLRGDVVPPSPKINGPCSGHFLHARGRCVPVIGEGGRSGTGRGRRAQAGVHGSSADRRGSTPAPRSQPTHCTVRQSMTWSRGLLQLPPGGPDVWRSRPLRGAPRRWNTQRGMTRSAEDEDSLALLWSVRVQAEMERSKKRHVQGGERG